MDFSANELWHLGASLCRVCCMIRDVFDVHAAHGIHVFVSSIASILYLISFGLNGWTDQVSGVFVVTIIAVMIPCCLSDIALPLACSHNHCKHKEITEESHAH